MTPSEPENLLHAMINAEPPCASMAEDVCTMLASVGILALALLLMWAF